MQLSITSSASDYAAWKYIVVINNTEVYVSDVPILLYKLRNPIYLGCSYRSSLNPEILRLIYLEDLNDWVAESFQRTTKTGATEYGSGSNNTTNIFVISEIDSSTTIQYNGEWNESSISFVSSFSNTLSLPHGLTESRVNELIYESLNATTSASASSNNLQQQAIIYYQQYIDGFITLNQLSVNLNNIVNQLNTLNQQPDVTLADKLAINNALTNTQIINDSANKDAIIDEMQNDLQVSTNISTAIQGKINQANQTFQNYSEGSVTQSEAVTQINQYITYLTSLISPQSTTADIEAVNTAINTINGIKSSITNYSELDENVSDNQVSSDEEELELLNDMVSVMQDQVIEDKMQDQQIAGKASTINNILNPVWENKFFSYLIGTSSVLIIACILLHVRYRML